MINLLNSLKYLYIRLLFDTPNSSSLSLRRDYFKPKSEIHSTTGQVTHFYSIMFYFYYAVISFTFLFELMEFSACDKNKFQYYKHFFFHFS